MKDKKVIFILLIVTMLFITSSVFGAINTVDQNEPTFIGKVLSVVGNIASVAGGAIISPFVSFIFAILMVLFMGMAFLFSPTTSGQTFFPFADQLVYNKLVFFDPNFINPSQNSVVSMIKDVISDMYFSFNIVAGAVFVIVAMVIGIKLAISTIATEKAHYKTALFNWLSGLVILVCLPFLIAGIFAVNEKVVEIAYTAVGDDNITFTVPISKAIATTVGGVAGGGIGIAVVNLFSGIMDDIGIDEGPADFDMPGFGGLIMKYMVLAATGDLAALIICGILIGQSAALVILYLRRLFYCIVLGMISPLVVAMDVYRKGI